MSEESTLWQVALLDRGEALVVMGRKKYDELYESVQELTKERDAARAEMDEFALAVGYGERPEGQSGVHRLSGEQLADRWKQIERELDEARAEVERLRSALRLLWEEAQDDCRCHHHGHMISQPCWETVTAALKEGDR